MIKKTVAIALFLFFVTTTSVMTAGLVVREINKNNNSSTNQTTNTITSNQTLTTAELAKHNTSGNCWLLISNQMYNVTSYIRSHPGGSNEIIRFCGQDATSAFQTKGGQGNNHSNAAYSMLAPYIIGKLNKTITTQQLDTSITQTNTTPPPANNGEVEDDD
jgi:cytochrome b involved in lipid metabolism